MNPGRYVLAPGTRALLHDLGISLGRVLRRAQLPAGAFAGQGFTMTPEEYFRFWDAVDAEAEDPDLPVRIGHAVSVEAFNPPIFAALCSADLRTAAERLAAFKPLVGPVGLEVAADRRGVTIAFRWPGGQLPPQLLVAAELAFLVALARIGTRCTVHAIRVTMRRAPARSDAMTSYFGTAIRTGELDAVTFSAEDATRPFLTQDESMWNFFAPELRRRLSQLEGSTTVADRVRAALHEGLPAGECSMTAVARQLAVGPRTLQRRLRAEGTTYQAMLTDTRERLARRYLADRSLSTAEIAYLLAYDDTNSFHRAFRGWTGTTPDAARAVATA